MGWFVFAIIIWIAAVLFIAVGALFGGSSGDSGKYSDSYSVSRGLCMTAGVIGLVLGFGLFALGGLKSVPVKSIGVPTAFGAVHGGVYGPGVHETWTPWLSLTEIDETVQTTTFEGDNALLVRIGGQQTAGVDVTIQWRVRPVAADSLFQDYAHHADLMKTVENAVVIRELKQVVNNVLGDYNPITDVQNVTGTSSSSRFSKLGPIVLQQMRADIGNRIDVLTVLMPLAHYAPSVEGKLNAIQAAYANYAIAVENVNVAHEQQLAYAKLGSPTGTQLVAQCLEEAKTNHNLQCIPGATTNLAIQGLGK
jgi:hypothetical protein